MHIAVAGGWVGAWWWVWCALGNSSQVSDGAAAVLLMKRSVALQKGLPILGVFRYFICNIEALVPGSIYMLIPN